MMNDYRFTSRNGLQSFMNKISTKNRLHLVKVDYPGRQLHVNLKEGEYIFFYQQALTRKYFSLFT